jgi:hypothetical protein
MQDIYLYDVAQYIYLHNMQLIQKDGMLFTAHYVMMLDKTKIF